MAGVEVRPEQRGRTVNELPCSTWALRSVIATQIQTAGRTWTSVSRQLVTSSRSPSNNSANAPTANASGANTRRDRLSRSTASSILASSPASMARIAR